MLTQSELKALLDYDALSGEFRWRADVNRIRAGSIAGNISPQGYRKIMIHERSYGAHRLVFLYVTGEFPPDDVDHINRVRDDNRFCNLRLATRGANHRNKGVYKNSKTGFAGITQRDGKFRAKICVNRQALNLGTFSSLEQAVAAYSAAKIKMHPESCR